MSCALFSMCGIRRSKSVGPGLCLWAPSKPKFLDRLISSRGPSSSSRGKYSDNRAGAGKKRGRRLLSNQDSSAERSSEEEEEEGEFISSGSTDNEGAAGYVQLLQDSQFSANGGSRSRHHRRGLASALSEPCSPVGEGAFVGDCGDGSGDDRDAAVSPPLPPILPGLVKQRCESYKRYHEELVAESPTSVKPQFAERRSRSQDLGGGRGQRCFSPVGEKADRLVKGYYSLQRDESFSKAVMERGYVRALAEQINSGSLPLAQEEGEEEGGGQPNENGDEDRNSNDTGGSNTDFESGDGKKQEDEVTCECTLKNQGGPTRGRRGKATQSDDMGKKMEGGRESSPSPTRLHQSMSPCDLDCCATGKKGDNNTTSGSNNTTTPTVAASSTGKKEKRVWSPRSRRKKSSDRPHSPPPAVPTKAKDKAGQQTSAANNSGSLQSPTAAGKASSPQSRPGRGKPAVDHSSKPRPKVGPPKPPSQAPSTLNGGYDSGKSPEKPDPDRKSPEKPDSDRNSPDKVDGDRKSPADKRGSRKSPDTGSSRSRSSSQCKVPAAAAMEPAGCQTETETTTTTLKEESSPEYNNVFVYPSNLNPHELFDMSWSDSESDEFSDSESDEDAVIAQRAREVGEAPPSVPKDKLHQIALELLTTEKAYVQRLSLLQNVFYFRIDQENRTQGFMPGDTLTQMFSSVQSIHQFHNDFLLKQLEDRMHNWESERRIGDLMKKNAPFLKLYTAYVKNFDNAMNLINTWLEKSQKFASIVQEIQKLPECGCLTLQHHMLGPIQRVPRYELLLKDYLKHLPEDSPDRPDAQDALDLVTTAAMHSNEAMKKIEKFHRLLDIYQRLRGAAMDFISPTRDFVREGPITKISARSGEKQSRYLFLFNDLLLICAEPLVGAYRVRAQLDVDGMEVKQADNLTIPNTFLVHSKQKAIELLDEQPSAGGTSWLESLKQVIEDLRSKKCSFSSTLNSPTEHELTTPGKQAPRWIPDDAATMCMLCQVVFNTFRRRHHCRACGKLICKSCCKKAPLEYMNNKLDRVCLECHDAIVFAGKKAIQSPGKSSKRKILQVKADDPGLLVGYLSISDDVGKTWNKRWFSLHDDFVMYFFKARQDVSAYHSLPLPGYQVETVSDADRPNVFCVYHHSINKKGILFQTDNEKIQKKWVNALSKLVLAQLPDESQRLSSQSNSSSASSGSDNANTSTTITTNTTANSTVNNNSDKLSQADSGFTASDSGMCEDIVADQSPSATGDEVTEDSVQDKS